MVFAPRRAVALSAVFTLGGVGAACGGGLGDVSNACEAGATCPDGAPGPIDVPPSTEPPEASDACPPGYVCYRTDAAPPPVPVQDAAPDVGPGPVVDAGAPECPPGYICIPVDASSDARAVDAENPPDAAVDAPLDAGGSDTGASDAADASSDAGEDASSDAGEDASSDAGVDAADAGPPPPTPTPPAAFVTLDYRVVDAEQSSALASIVMVSDTPSSALHIFDEVTQNDRAVALPKIPVAVAVDPSGKNAAVAYDANVSWVDLTTGTIRSTCPLSSNAYDLTLSDQGTAYVVPRTDQWVSLHTVDLTRCTEVVSSTLRAGSHIDRHPSGVAVFTADQGLSPSRVQRCDVSLASPNCVDALNYADWGTYAFCGNLWVSADGQRIYTACGVTLRVPGNVNANPCTYGGSLPGVTSIVHASEAPYAQQIALIPGSGGDVAVRIHETSFLNFVKQVSLPPFPIADAGATVAHGRFVFATTALDMLYVIVQADPSSGALHDYGIASFRP